MMWVCASTKQAPTSQTNCARWLAVHHPSGYDSDSPQAAPPTQALRRNNWLDCWRHRNNAKDEYAHVHKIA